MKKNYIFMMAIYGFFPQDNHQGFLKTVTAGVKSALYHGTSYVTTGAKKVGQYLWKHKKEAATLAGAAVALAAGAKYTNTHFSHPVLEYTKDALGEVPQYIAKGIYHSSSRAVHHVASGVWSSLGPMVNNVARIAFAAGIPYYFGRQLNALASLGPSWGR